MDVDNKRLSLKFTVAVMTVFIAATCLYIVRDMSSQSEAIGDKALAEARTLNLQMKACWDYIDDAQFAINYNSDGSYDFKDVYCAVAAKNIARRFTRQAQGYEIRYARTNPRSGTDEPDPFEAEAIALTATAPLPGRGTRPAISRRACSSATSPASQASSSRSIPIPPMRARRPWAMLLSSFCSG